MKKISIVIFVLLYGFTEGQTLTQAFNEPIITDVDKNYRLDTSAYTTGMPLNVTGNNCTWNFTNLAGAFPMIVDSFIAPMAATGGSDYPTATYAQTRDFSTFFKSSPQQTEIIGGYTPTLSLTFTNTAIIASYPISYGYSLSDPISGSFKRNTNTGACNGSITVTADGLGTLNLPNSLSIANVLRLKSVEELTLSSGFFPFATFKQTVYNYYKPGKKFPILNMNYTSYQLIAGTATNTAYTYGSNDYFTVAGINRPTINQESYRVFPNPFHEHLNLNAKNPIEQSTYTFYDINGAVALEATTLADGETGKLLPGIYFLEIKNKLGVFHQKIIKE